MAPRSSRTSRSDIAARALSVASASGDALSNTVSRLVVAAVALPIVLGAVYLGGWWLFVLVDRRGNARAARVLAARAAAEPALAGGLRRRDARARRR